MGRHRKPDNAVDVLEKNNKLSSIEELTVIQANLEKEVNDLKNQKASLEASFSSVKYQTEQYRANEMNNIQVEKAELLIELRNKINGLNQRESKIIQIESDLAIRECELNRKEQVAQETENKIADFNKQMVTIEKRYREAEELMEKATILDAESICAKKAYNEMIVDVNNQKQKLEKNLLKFQTDKNQLITIKNELEERIKYNETLVKNIKENIKKLINKEE